VDRQSLKVNAAGAGRCQPQQRAPDRGLAAARFSYQAQRSAALQAEADAVDGFDVAADLAEQAASDREVFFQRAYVEQGFVWHHFSIS
jgi:hypothetical protein